MTIAPDYDGYVIRPSATPAAADCMRRTIPTLWPALVTAAGFTVRELPNHVGANVGSGVHTGAAHMLRYKMEHGDLGTTVVSASQLRDDAIEAAIDTFDTRCRDEGVVWDQTTGGRNTAHQQIKRMTKQYRKDAAPNLNPVFVEERLDAEISPGFLLSGQMDQLIMEPGGPHDLKTGTQRRANLAQYGCYSMLAKSHGNAVEQIVEDFLPRVRLNKEQPPVDSHKIPVEIAEMEAVRVIDDLTKSVDVFQEAVAQGAPHPEAAFRANPYSNLCSDRFCPAWGTKFCRAHLGAK